MRILLVEDSETTARQVRQIVEAEGWTLEHVPTGMMSLTRVLAAPPDVILLDFVLPDMDGLEVLKLFSKTNVRAPTIVLTGVMNPDVMRRFAAAGAADYLAKEDLTAARLRQAIRMAKEMGPAPTPALASPPRPLRDAHEAGDAPAVDPRGKVILLVDDTASFRAIVRRALDARGWVVLEAGDASSAIATAAQHRPDVVLLDHVLPDDDGLAVMRALRDRGLAARVVAFTGHGDEALAETFLREGAVDYVAKDTSITRVVRSVERALWLGGARVDVTWTKPRA